MFTTFENIPAPFPASSEFLPQVLATVDSNFSCGKWGKSPGNSDYMWAALCYLLTVSLTFIRRSKIAYRSHTTHTCTHKITLRNGPWVKENQAASQCSLFSMSVMSLRRAVKEKNNCIGKTMSESTLPVLHREEEGWGRGRDQVDNSRKKRVS